MGAMCCRIDFAIMFAPKCVTTLMGLRIREAESRDRAFEAIANGLFKINAKHCVAFCLPSRQFNHLKNDSHRNLRKGAGLSRLSSTSVWDRFVPIARIRP
jgi:hypothetical protein